MNFLYQNVYMVQRYKTKWWAARNWYYSRGWRMNSYKNTYIALNTKTQLNLSAGPIKIADEFKRFRCNGWVHYGRLSTSQSSTYKNKKVSPSSFKEISNFRTKTKSSNPKKRVKCYNNMFGDVAPYYRKQCFCEAKPRKAPIVCAKEGQWCR